MNIIQHFFIEGRYQGSVERKTILRYGNRCYPDSYLFFCRYCGDVFAKCPVMVDDIKVEWLSISSCCPRCEAQSIFDIPGALWVAWDEDFLKALPLPILRREFDLTYQHCIKMFGDDYVLS